jgi:hypothetical protein
MHMLREVAGKSEQSEHTNKTLFGEESLDNFSKSIVKSTNLEVLLPLCIPRFRNLVI